MAITMPFALIAALAFGAFAVDLGHVFLARTELQTAADASALTGAGTLLAGGSTPNWSSASASAATAVSLNSSDGVTLKNASVQTGFWNLANASSGLKATNITPGAYDAPAVQVIVSRAAGLNGGAIGFWFAKLFGVGSGPASATAVAIVAAPGYVAPGGLFPVAIGKCIYSQYWNVQSGTPAIDPATGKPFTIQIGNGATYRGCEAGQWTSFQTDNNDVTTVRGLISGGNPTGLSIGDAIWIEPGVKTSIYANVPSNIDVLVPVVEQATTSRQPVIAFAAFHIDNATGGSGKYIEGHFIAGYKITASAGQVGPYYGAYVPPRLAR